jgi:NADPH:quinone reductase-like Zn-dependent oxidoreductase
MTAKSVSAARADSAGPGTINTMKAIRIHRRGGPEALVYEDAAIPALQPGDALVRVHAATPRPSSIAHLGDARRPQPAH